MKQALQVLIKPTSVALFIQQNIVVSKGRPVDPVATTQSQRLRIAPGNDFIRGDPPSLLELQVRAGGTVAGTGVTWGTR